MNKIVVLTSQIKKPHATSSYPVSLNSNSKRALFDNLNKNETLALILDDKILTTKDDDWRATHIKRKKVEILIRNILNQNSISDETEVKRIYNLVYNQRDY